MIVKSSRSISGKSGGVGSTSGSLVLGFEGFLTGLGFRFVFVCFLLLFSGDSLLSSQKASWPGDGGKDPGVFRGGFWRRKSFGFGRWGLFLGVLSPSHKPPK